MNVGMACINVPQEGTRILNYSTGSPAIGNKKSRANNERPGAQAPRETMVTKSPRFWALPTHHYHPPSTHKNCTVLPRQSVAETQPLWCRRLLRQRGAAPFQGSPCIAQRGLQSLGTAVLGRCHAEESNGDELEHHDIYHILSQ